MQDLGGTTNTHTTAFIKQEMNFTHASRLISAREKAVRQISAVIVEKVTKQVYKETTMIKGMDQDMVLDTIIDRIGRFRNVLCTDIASYDAAQSGRIWEIEQELIKQIVPEFADLWDVIALQSNCIVKEGRGKH